MGANGDAGNLTIGSAPDSWGVWHAADPVQVPWQTFLDEVSQAGYTWIELGPFGYLPTDPARLSDELGSRGLRLSAGTVFEHLHHDNSWDDVWKQVSDVAALAQSQGAEYVVVIPYMWREDTTGEVLEPRGLGAAGWDRKTTGLDRLSRAILDEYGMRVVYHPHADSHIDTNENVGRLLENTDPGLVTLCLDTGHISYCGGDNLALIRDYRSRIGYVHLKQVDPAVKARVDAEDLPFGAAVKMGATCEPPQGIPDMPSVLDALDGLGRPLFAIVEQDLYPCAPEVPLPIATRTLQYLTTRRLPATR